MIGERNYVTFSDSAKRSKFVDSMLSAANIIMQNVKDHVIEIMNDIVEAKLWHTKTLSLKFQKYEENCL